MVTFFIKKSHRQPSKCHSIPTATSQTVRITSHGEFVTVSDVLHVVQGQSQPVVDKSVTSHVAIGC